MRSNLTAVAGVAALLGVTFGAGPAGAQDAAAFYKGKQLTITVGNPPGGTYDLYARMTARHLPKYIPGTPSAIVQNMPGAGGMVSLNWLYNQAPKDGTVFGTYSNGLAFEEVFGNPSVQFDPLKINWLISLSKQYVVGFVWSDHPARSLEDLRTQTIVVPGTGPSTSTVVFPTLFNAVLGTKFDVIRGYSGTGETMLSIERGETQGLCCTDYTAVLTGQPDWVNEKRIRFIIQAGVEKHPDLPDVPWVMDMIESGDDRRLMDLFLARQLIGRPFGAPPEVPADRVEALRAAMMEMTRDAGFVEEANKQGVDVDPVGPDEIIAMLEEVLGGPPEVGQRARDIMTAATKTRERQ